MPQKANEKVTQCICKLKFIKIRKRKEKGEITAEEVSFE